jgi:hypothetical protein
MIKGCGRHDRDVQTGNNYPKPTKVVLNNVLSKREDIGRRRWALAGTNSNCSGPFLYPPENVKRLWLIIQKIIR